MEVSLDRVIFNKHNIDGTMTTEVCLSSKERGFAVVFILKERVREMHIPDGFLSPGVWVPAAAISTGALGYSIKQAQASLKERQIPVLGIMSAFIFAGQMVNFPVAGGTSGHLLGAALATSLLGPWSASLILATVLIIQSLFFQDGGITALGANILNMAVIGVGTAWLMENSLKKLRLPAGVSNFLAGWVSVMAAAVAASLELAISGTIPLAKVLPAMAFWHALIGIGEGMLTAVAVNFVFKNRLVYEVEQEKAGWEA